MSNMDQYLEMLEQLKIVPERDVKIICEKVTPIPLRSRRSSSVSPIWSR